MMRLRVGDAARARAAIAAALVAAGVEFAVAIELALDAGRWSFLSPIELVAEAVFVILCAWGLIRRSRTAAIALSLTFLLDLVQSVTLATRWWLPWVCGVWLCAALQAIPPIWRLERSRPPSRSPVFTAIGTTTGLAIVASAIWFAKEIALAPPTRILPRAQVPAAYSKRLVELGAFVTDVEQLLYFYSPAFGRFDSEFYALTTQHLVAFHEDWEIPLVRVPYAEIAEIDEYYSHSWYQNSVVYIRDRAGLELAVPASSEAGGDARFFSELRRQFVHHGGSLSQAGDDGK